ncbi:MAG: large subunit ribosomal protein [Thermoleophilaceae bacterium]|jgi:large subunit ribosomal protein L30|nr:large subunit ribosomal protein [Thermoleophilaceae bacterium]
MATLRLTQFKSKNGANPKARESLRSLGLGKIGSTVEREDSPQLRGAIYKVRHLVKVED